MNRSDKAVYFVTPTLAHILTYSVSYNCLLVFSSWTWLLKEQGMCSFSASVFHPLWLSVSFTVSVCWSASSFFPTHSHFNGSSFCPWMKENKQKKPQKQTAQHNKQPCSYCLRMPLLLVSAEMFSQITVLVCICVFRIALWLLRLCNFTDVNKTNSLMLRVHKVSLAPLQQQYRVNKSSNTNRETLTVHDLCFDGVRVRRRVANLFEGQNRMRDNPHTHAYD